MVLQVKLIPAKELDELSFLQRGFIAIDERVQSPALGSGRPSWVAGRYPIRLAAEGVGRKRNSPQDLSLIEGQPIQVGTLRVQIGQGQQLVFVTRITFVMLSL